MQYSRIGVVWRHPYPWRRPDQPGALGINDLEAGDRVLVCEIGSPEERPAEVVRTAYRAGGRWYVLLRFDGDDETVERFKPSRLGLAPNTPETAEHVGWSSTFVKREPTRQ